MYLRLKVWQTKESVITTTTDTTNGESEAVRMRAEVIDLEPTVAF